MACPKCQKPYLCVEDNKLFCQCGYIEEVNCLSYDQLLKENERLKEIIKDLEMK